MWELEVQVRSIQQEKKQDLLVYNKQSKWIVWAPDGNLKQPHYVALKQQHMEM